ncbi:MAG: phosphatidate cytidylyltransferase [Elusimicrobia bacterium]|nr:phosphatidate cytidylyltransferase [Elusimicrobiota bacterium]
MTPGKELLKEAGRKAFHQLSLAYLVAYHLLGYPRIVRWMIPWTIFVLAVETARLHFAGLNRFLFNALGALARPEETSHYSGIVYTTLGAFILFLAFKTQSAYVAAGLFCVSLGDTAAALVGKSFGRHRIFGSKKSVEGSLACFIVCACVGLSTGFSLTTALAGASAGTLIEFLPTTIWLNDNMWMPIAVAGALRLCAG